jgi:hypothetical protein
MEVILKTGNPFLSEKLDVEDITLSSDYQFKILEKVILEIDTQSFMLIMNSLDLVMPSNLQETRIKSISHN